MVLWVLNNFSFVVVVVVVVTQNAMHWRACVCFSVSLFLHKKE